MPRFDLRDEHTNHYGPFCKVDETTIREYGASLATLAVLALGAVLMLSSMGGAENAPDSAVQLTADGRH